MRVLDVGQGLSCIIKAPGYDGRPRYMIYDAGLNSNAMPGIREVMGTDRTIELVVLSHGDADHIGAVPQIFTEFTVRRVLRGGDRDLYTSNGSLSVFGKADQAIRESPSTMDWDLREFEKEGRTPFSWGRYVQIGKARAFLVAGWNDPNAAGFDFPDVSERRNAGSIIVRLDYEGHAVLFTGDTVGRHIGDLEPADDTEALAEIKFPEEFLVAQAREWAEAPWWQARKFQINADVLIAPHHGADNGCSSVFLREVSPEYVIFSAGDIGYGNSYRHPRLATVERILEAGVPVANLFRTDLGGYEPHPDDLATRDPLTVSCYCEWHEGSAPGPEWLKDPWGDDDIDVVLPKEGRLKVCYSNN